MPHCVFCNSQCFLFVIAGSQQVFKVAQTLSCEFTANSVFFTPEVSLFSLCPPDRVPLTREWIMVNSQKAWFWMLIKCRGARLWWEVYLYHAYFFLRGRVCVCIFKVKPPVFLGHAVMLMNTLCKDFPYSFETHLEQRGQFSPWSWLSNWVNSSPNGKPYELLLSIPSLWFSLYRPTLFYYYYITV